VAWQRFRSGFFKTTQAVNTPNVRRTAIILITQNHVLFQQKYRVVLAMEAAGFSGNSPLIFASWERADQVVSHLASRNVAPTPLLAPRPDC
jgi:hypothetical protein